MLLATVWLARLFVRRIEGYTGDCLGSVQQLSEVCCYLGLLAQWRCSRKQSNLANVLCVRWNQMGRWPERAASGFRHKNTAKITGAINP